MSSLISRAVSKIYGAGKTLISFSRNEYTKQWEYPAPDKEIKIGDFVLPDHVSNILVAGTTGAGKTNTIKHILPQIREAGQKAIVVCDANDVLPSQYREGDIVFNPFDTRFPNWDLWAEFKAMYDFRSVADALIRDNEFAAGLLAALLEKAINHDELVALAGIGTEHVLQIAGAKQIRKISNPPEGDAVSVGVTMAKVQAAVNSLGLFAPKSSEAPKFSLREWAANADDSRWVFLPVRDDQLEILKPVFSLALELVAGEVLSVQSQNQLPVEKRQNLWFAQQGFLVSFPFAGQMMAIGHRFGAKTLFESWDSESFESKFGRVSDSFDAIAMHRMNDLEQADQMVRVLKNDWLWTAPNIQASDLMLLPELTCQVVVRGMQHPTKVAIPIAGK